MSRLPGFLRSRTGSAGLLKLVPLVLAGSLGLLGLTVLPSLGGPAAAPALLAPPPSDTTYFYGPKPDSASATGRVHLDQILIPVAAGTQYWLELTNGAPDGTHRVDSAKVRWNGRQFIGASDFTSLIESQEKVLAAVQTDTLRVQLWGPTTAYATVRVYGVPDPSFTVYGDTTFTKSNGSTQTWTRTFTTPGDAQKRFYLFLVNGDSLGANRVGTARIKVNGTIRMSNTSITSAVGSAVALFDTLPAGGGEVEVQLTGASGTFVRVRIAASDSLAPTLAVTAPAESAWTTLSSVPVTGTLSDRTAVAVKVNGVSATVTGGTSFSGAATLATDGAHTLTVVATDAADNQSTVTRVVRRDTQAPALAVSNPADNAATQAALITVDGTAADANPFGVRANGTPLTLTSGAFSGMITLVYGPNTIVTSATDSAGNVNTVVRTVTWDTLPPVLTVAAPVDNSTTSADSVDVIGTATDATPVALVVNGLTTAVAGGAFTRRVALAPGSNTITVTATDQVGKIASATRTVTRTVGLPPDPATVAPPLDPTVATTMDRATAFLYTGANPIQTGVAAGTIEPRRVAVLRGRVLDRADDPLPGVTVRVLDHPEFGQTLTRDSTGMFDLAVNGGGPLTLVYARGGYLSAQRTLTTPWQDYAIADDVVLIPLDTAVATVTFTQPIEVARGTPQTDDDGTRRATLLFRQGTQATMVLPDGSTEALSTLHVRATEYTVGPNGRTSMPGTLPPASAFTYAIEASVDEAMAAGATQVRFSQPVAFYVENFLHLPVGVKVPFGSFDRERSVWVSETAGRVVEVLDTAGGLATLDVNGSGQAASQAALDSLGITSAERAHLATLYPAQQELWRMAMSHFSPHDPNLQLQGGDGPPLSGGPRTPDEPQPECTGGSIIECENAVLGERLPVTGTGLTLNYRSSRVPGSLANGDLVFEIIGDTVPSDVIRIDVTVDVAGRRFTQSYPAVANQVVTFSFDGLDPYGRPIQGGASARVELAWVRPLYYWVTQGNAAMLGLPCNQGEETPGVVQCIVPDSIGRQFGQTSRAETARLGRFTTVAMGAAGGPSRWDATGQKLGGWTLSQHHAYAPATQMLYLGDGGRRAARSVNAAVVGIAGTTIAGFSGDSGPAVAAELSAPVSVAVGPDRRLFVADRDNHRIRMVDSAGIITTIAGTGTPGFNGDSILATLAELHSPTSLALAPDGSLYFVDAGNLRVRRISPNGVITTVAGDGNSCDVQVDPGCGQGGPATLAQLSDPSAMALGPDGAIYIADRGMNRIRWVGPSGVMSTVAGSGVSCDLGADSTCGEGGPAVWAPIGEVRGLAVSAEGRLYLSDATTKRVRRVDPDGLIHTVAGTGTGGDGGPALSARLAGPQGLAVTPDGSLYIADFGNSGNLRDGRVRRVSGDGTISTVAGPLDAPGVGAGGVTINIGLSCDRVGEGGPATAAVLCEPSGLSVAPDGRVYIGEAFGNRVLEVRNPFPGYTSSDLAIPAPGGGEIYQFDATGRHLRTVEAASGAARWTFGYDSLGLLTSITDGSGQVTTISRDAGGTATAIVGPFGHQTGLVMDSAGFLRKLTNPAGDSTVATYASGGLLTSLTDPNGNRHVFHFDGLGRLVSDSSPAGGAKTPVRTVDRTGVTTTVTTALGRSTTYRSEMLADGSKRRTTTAPWGGVTTRTERSDGSALLTMPGGVAAAYGYSADPVHGMTAPMLDSMVVSTPGGLLFRLLTGSGAVLGTPGDPLSVVSRVDTAFVNGRPFLTEFTAALRRYVSTTPEGRQTTTIVDSLDRVVEVQTPGLHTVSFSYNAAGQLSEIAAGGRSVIYAYNAAGQLASVTDPLGRTTSYAYDANGRVTSQTLPGGAVVGFGYDANGNLTAVTPPGRSAHTLAYNSVDLGSGYTPPGPNGALRGVTASYNADRQVSQLSLPDTQTVSFSYDSAGRSATITVPTGTLQSGYDPSSGTVLSLSSPGGVTLTYSYDGLLPTGVSWSGPITGSVGYDYNNDFAPAAVRVNGTSLATFGYDQDGLLTDAGQLVITRANQTGLILGTTVGGVATSLSHNGFGELTSQTATFGGTTLYQADYTRDNGGRIIGLTETARGVTTTWDYDYYASGRLFRVVRDSADTTIYSYDANGNPLQMVSPLGSVTGTYDGEDRLLTYGGATYTYNNAGQLTQKDQGGQLTSYTYDVLGNLTGVSLPDSTKIGYLVDGQGRRIGRTVNGVLVRGWLWQGQLAPVAELDSAGNVVSRFVYGTRVNVPDYMERGGATYRLVTNHLGSVALVVNASTGQVVAWRDYDEWGRVVADSNPDFQPFGFAGGLSDADTRLVHFNAREYAPDEGRWGSKDPSGPIADGANLYSYANGNPLYYYDPTGLFGWRDAAGFIPVIGSGLDAFDAFSCGNIGMGALHTGLAVLDLTGLTALVKGMTVGSFKWGAREALREAYGTGRSMAWDNLRERLLRRELVTPGRPTHHWFFRQAGDAPDWILNHVANLMPDISDPDHRLAHHGTPLDKLMAGTPTWAKFAIGGLASYMIGLFVDAECECE